MSFEKRTSYGINFSENVITKPLKNDNLVDYAKFISCKCLPIAFCFH